MATFGEDQFDREIKQLKTKLAQKDHQLTTIINEQHKKEELFDSERRAKQDAIHRLQVEADRAVKAEKTLALKTSELSSLNMKLSNLESTLVAAQEKQKKDEKEIERLQYEIDVSRDGSNNAKAQSRIQDQHASLQTRIKELEAALSRSESEKETLRAESSLSEVAGYKREGGANDRSVIFELQNQLELVRRENVKLMEQSRNAPDGSTEDLRAELQSLRDQLDNQQDSTALQTSLSAAKREALKLENEKMALERSLQREISGLKSSLDDAYEELDDLRRDRGGASSSAKDVEKAKKAAQNTIDELTRKLAEKEAVIEKLQSSISDTEATLRDREAELATQNETLQKARQSSDGADNASAATTGSAQLEKQIRRLQREVTKISNEKAVIEASLEENDELLAQKDEEILRLRANVPIPGSPPSSSARVESHEALQQELVKLQQRLEEVEAQWDTAKAAYESLAKDNSKAVEESSAIIASLNAQLEGEKAAIKTQQKEAGDLRSSLSVQVAESEELRNAAETAQSQVEQLSTTVQRLEMEECGLRQQLITAAEDLAQAQEKAKSSAEDASTATLDLAHAETELARLRQVVSDLEAAAADRSSVSEARERDVQILNLEEELATATKRVHDLESAVELAESIRDDADRNAREAENRLASETLRLRRELQSRQKAISRLEEQLSIAAAEKERLERTVEELSNMAAQDPDVSIDADGYQRLLGFAEDERQALIAAHEHGLRAKDAEMDAVRSELEGSRSQMAALELTLAETSQARKVLESRCQAAADQIAVVETDLRALRRQQDSWLSAPIEGDEAASHKLSVLQGQVRELDARVQRRNQQIASEQNKIRKLELNLALANDSLSEWEEREVIADRTAAFLVIDLVRSSKAGQALLDEVKTLQEARQRLQEQLTDEQASAARLDSEHAVLSKEAQVASEITSRLGEAEAQLAAAEQKCQRLVAEAQAAESSGAEYAEEIKRLEDNVARLEVLVQDQQSQLGALAVKHEEALRDAATAKEESAAQVANLQASNDALRSSLPNVDALKAEKAELASQLQRLQQDHDQAVQDLSSAQQALDLANAQQRQQEAEIAESNQDIEQRLTELTNERNELSAAVESVRAEIAELQDSLAQQAAAGEQSATRVQRLERELNQVNHDREDILREAEALAAELDVAQHKVIKLENECRESERELTNMTNALQRRDETETSAGEKMTLLRRMNDEIDAARAAAIDEVAGLKVRLADVEQQLSDRAEQVDALESQLDQQNNDLEERNDEVRALKRESNALQRKVEKLERKSKATAPPTLAVPSAAPPTQPASKPSSLAPAIESTPRLKRERDEEIAVFKEPQAIVAPAPYDRTPNRKAFTPRRTPQKPSHTDENASAQQLHLPTKMSVFADKPALSAVAGIGAIRARLGSRQ